MYIPRNNPRSIPTLAKRCLICGRFLFNRNLGKNERYHKLKTGQLICHSCLVDKEKERLENANKTENNK